MLFLMDRRVLTFFTRVTLRLILLNLTNCVFAFTLTLTIICLFRYLRCLNSTLPLTLLFRVRPRCNLLWVLLFVWVLQLLLCFEQLLLFLLAELLLSLFQLLFQVHLMPTKWSVSLFMFIS